MIRTRIDESPYSICNPGDASQGGENDGDGICVDE